MKLNKAMKTLLPLAAFAGLAVTANAATLVYVGNQLNFESKADDPTVGWRNTVGTTNLKPLDIDGDNIYGTDGYHTFGDSRAIISLPTYISAVTNLGTNKNSGFGFIDDPGDPTGADTTTLGGWHAADDIFSFTVSGTELVGQTLRVGIFYDTLNFSGSQTFTLSQTAGLGAGTASSSLLTFSFDGPDIAFFDLTDVVAGDEFTISSVGTGSQRQAGGIVFDVVPEPSSTALLGLGGLALILRRRRK